MVGVGLDTVKQIESQLSSATTKVSCGSAPRPGRAAGGGQGHPGRVIAEQPRRSRTSPPATSSGPTSAAAPSSGSRPRTTWTRATWCPTRSPSRWSGTGWRRRTPRPASCSTASRAPSPQAEPLRDVARRPRRGARRVLELGRRRRRGRPAAVRPAACCDDGQLFQRDDDKPRPSGTGWRSTASRPPRCRASTRRGPARPASTPPARSRTSPSGPSSAGRSTMRAADAG